MPPYRGALEERLHLHGAKLADGDIEVRQAGDRQPPPWFYP